MPSLYTVPSNAIASAPVLGDLTGSFASIQIGSLDNPVNLYSGQFFSLGSDIDPFEYGSGVIRKDYTGGGILQVVPRALGGVNQPLNIVKTIDNAPKIFFYMFYPLYARYGRISNGIIFKDYDLGYANQTRNQSLVVNMTPWQAVKIESGSVGTVTIQATSFQTMAGRIPVNAMWRIDGGGTLIENSFQNQTAEAVFEAAAGFYVITCTLIDQEGRSSLGRTYVWVDDGSSQDWFTQLPMTITQDVSTKAGRTMTFTCAEVGNVFKSILPGSGALFVDDSYDDWALGDDQIRNFIGYVESVSSEISQYHGITSLTISSPRIALESVGAASHALTEKNSPVEWVEGSPEFSNPLGMLQYILQWSVPAMLENHGLHVPSFSIGHFWSQRRQAIFLTGDSIGALLSQLESAAVGVLGSDSTGRTSFMHDPALWMYPSERAAALQTTEIPSVVFRGVQTKSTVFRPQVNQVLGYSFAYAGGETSEPFGAKAPGEFADQGIGKPTIPSFTVPAADPQNRTNWVVGQAYAQANRSWVGTSFLFSGAFDIFDPSNPHRQYLFDDLRLQMLGVSGAPESVTRNWVLLNGYLYKDSVSVEFSMLSQGLPGVPVPVERSAGWAWVDRGLLPFDFSLYIPKPDAVVVDDPEQFLILLALDDQGRVGRTSGGLDPSVKWQPIQFDQKIQDIKIDFTSPYFTDPDLPLNVWAVASTGRTVQVYQIQDALGPVPTWNEVRSITVPANIRKIRCASSRDADRYIIGILTDQGVYSVRRVSGNWQATAGLVGATGNPPAEFDDLGVAIIGTVFFCPGWNATNGWAVYRATNLGAFNELGGKPVGRNLKGVPTMAAHTIAGTHMVLLKYHRYWQNVASTELTSQISWGNVPEEEPLISRSDHPDAQNTPVNYGFHYVYRTPDQVQGASYDLNRLRFFVSITAGYPSRPDGIDWGNPPGPPSYAPPGNWGDGSSIDDWPDQDFVVSFVAYNPQGSVIYTHPEVTFKLTTPNSPGEYSSTTTYQPSPSGFSRVIYSKRRHFDIEFPDGVLENFGRLEVRMASVNKINLGLGYFVDIPSIEVTYGSAGFGDMIWNVSKTVIDADQIVRIGQATSGSPGWGVSSSNHGYPTRAYQTAWNAAGDPRFNIIGDLAGKKSLLTTGLTGTLLDQGAFAYDGLKVYNTTRLAFGWNKLDLISGLGPGRVYPRVGDWTRSIGPFSRFIDVIGLF